VARSWLAVADGGSRWPTVIRPWLAVAGGGSAVLAVTDGGSAMARGRPTAGPAVARRGPAADRVARLWLGGRPTVARGGPAAGNRSHTARSLPRSGPR